LIAFVNTKTLCKRYKINRINNISEDYAFEILCLCCVIHLLVYDDWFHSSSLAASSSSISLPRLLSSSSTSIAESFWSAGASSSSFLPINDSTNSAAFYLTASTPSDDPLEASNCRNFLKKNFIYLGLNCIVMTLLNRFRAESTVPYFISKSK